MTRRSLDQVNAAQGWVVLLVDDTEDNLTVASAALKFSGAEVYTATNGAEGLEHLETLTPTVILLDIRMPKMDGFQMFKLVRANPQLAHVPIIAVTAHAMEGDREDILNAGFDGYIAKPFDLFNFVPYIAQCLQQAQQKQAIAKDANV